MDGYIKTVGSNELAIQRIASEYHIAPDLIRSYELDGNHVIVTKMYPASLTDINDKVKYRSQIIDLVKRLHSLDIYHGDIHEDNIVVDPNSNDVRIIDYGRSKFINQMGPRDLKESIYSGEPVANMGELLDQELNEVKFIT